MTDDELDVDEKDIDRQLTEIYENKDGSMPDMHTFEKRPRMRLLRAFFMLIMSLSFFAGVAWVGLFVIQPKTQFVEEDIMLSISGDEEVKAGQEVTYRVRYRNAQGVTLQNTTLEMRYPQGFKFVTSTISPSNEQHDVWELGDIDPQEGDFIDITGRVYGDIQQKQSLRAFLNYTPANFSSQFQKVSYIELITNESIVQLDVELPKEIPVSSEIPIHVTITPEEPVQYITVSCEGDIFSAKTDSRSGQDEGKECSWSFDNLIEEQQIDFSGSFVSTDPIDDAHLVFTIRGWDNEQREGEGYVLAHIDTPVTLVQEHITLNLAINGGMSSLTAQPGESLNTSIVIKNSGDVVMNNVRVEMILDAPSYQKRSILSWPKIDVPDDADIFGEQISETIRRGVIIWDSRYVSGLAKIMPGEEVHINMSLPIRDNTQTTLANFEASQITGKVEIQYGNEDDLKIISSNNINIDIVSDMDFEVRDDVDEDMDNPIHTVTWLLSNSFHELKDIVVEADVYGDVALSSDDFVVPAGELSYDTESQHIIWTIDQMPVGLDVLAAQFNIMLMKENKSQTQLMSKVKVRAYDMVSQQQVLLVGDEIVLSYDDVLE